jgi:hypothetical protein
MLDVCGRHNITAEVEVIPTQRVNDAYERLLKSDVKYRFSMASPAQAVTALPHRRPGRNRRRNP